MLESKGKIQAKTPEEVNNSEKILRRFLQPVRRTTTAITRKYSIMDAAALLAMKEFAGDDGDINLDSLIFEDGADEALASMLASPSGLPLEFDFEGGDTSSTDLEDDELGSIGSSDTNTSTSSKPSSPSMTDETISVASDDDDD